ncbi:carbonic anhydrase 2-like [Clavelina lepadiformis]|uniref:carbonic anhydrase 2-like n=1 Tax=Clavelina lepadiformis TaxID=159417 RepID=UPI004042F0EA
MIIGFCLSVLCFFTGQTAGSSWEYSSPESWSREYPACGGRRQSPINIDTSEAESSWILERFPKSLFSEEPEKMTLKNNGHSIQVDLTGGFVIDNVRLLFDRYKAVQFHAHWAKSNGKGSEHTINDKRYWGELHIVLYNTDYEDFESAVSKSDGLAVLAFFIYVSNLFSLTKVL